MKLRVWQAETLRDVYKDKFSVFYYVTLPS